MKLPPPKKHPQVELEEDHKLFRAIGYIGSVPAKLILWNRSVGSYPTDSTIDYIVEVLEANRELSDVIVRVGHTRILEDCLRMFYDENLKREMSTPVKLFLGIPVTLAGGIKSKLSRDDNYNPLTKTVTVYSDVPAIALHEIGHAEDFSGRKHKVLYLLSRILPPMELYQEAKASAFAYRNLSDEDKYQGGRYLVPAFSTYFFSFLGPLYPVGIATAHVAGRILNRISSHYGKKPRGPD